MGTFTLDDLRRVIRGCVGESDAADLDGDIGDLDFSELGYDSLALLEVTATLQNELGVPIPDEAVDRMRTPRLAVDYVNARIAAWSPAPAASAEVER